MKYAICRHLAEKAFRCDPSPYLCHVPPEPHTQVPNLIYDIVLWVVSDVERDCLLYIIRRTYGYHNGEGERKNRDVISLKQFETGITTGDYLLDLGTCRSSGAIRSALESLHEKELVDPRYACLVCMWEEGEESQPHKGNVCPRCNASLTKSWALASLTPNKILNLLNNNPHQKAKGRSFEWDPKARRFRVIDRNVKVDREQKKKALEDEYQKLRSELWYPDMVQDAIDLAAKKLKSGNVSLSRQVNGFLKPVVKMQQKYESPPLVKYALEQTLKGPVFSGDRPTNNWHRYADKVAANNISQFKNRKTEESVSAKSASDVDREIRDLLRDAARLNGSGKTDEARRLLDDILVKAGSVSTIMDKETAERQIRLAFKQGQSDWVGAKPDRFAPDYLPESGD